MTHEAVPETPRQTAHTVRAVEDPARQEPDGTAASGAPKGLLRQMEELMAALNADLSRLDADLQSSADRTSAVLDPSPAPDARTAGSARPSYRPF
ncbi:hypothetical protein ACFWUQ_26555 [Streptomyces sp. NPDC058662]|uniref:hypothetical protein n=1 Tax=Streptomyces sp. NPDC058662 TaxID=3346583 RepID=UPI00364A39E8